jgi:hypothetical protein
VVTHDSWVGFVFNLLSHLLITDYWFLDNISMFVVSRLGMRIWFWSNPM